MTLATDINPNLLLPFLRLHEPGDPDEAAIAAFITDQQPGPLVHDNLLRWYDATQRLDVETDVCTNCWAITVVPTGSTVHEPIMPNACDGCQRTICDNCHRHQPGPWHERCQCPPCADATPTMPDQYESVRHVLAQYLDDCALREAIPTEANTLNRFLVRHNPSTRRKVGAETISVMRDWRTQSARGDIYNLRCRTCNVMAISEEQDDLVHICEPSQERSPQTTAP